MAARKQKATEYPADILAMSIEELRREDDSDSTEEFDRLLAIRDEAQQKLSAHLERKRQITHRLVELLYVDKEELSTEVSNK